MRRHRLGQYGLLGLLSLVGLLAGCSESTQQAQQPDPELRILCTRALKPFFEPVFRQLKDSLEAANNPLPLTEVIYQPAPYLKQAIQQGMAYDFVLMPQQVAEEHLAGRLDSVAFLGTDGIGMARVEDTTEGQQCWLLPGSQLTERWVWYEAQSGKYRFHFSGCKSFVQHSKNLTHKLTTLPAFHKAVCFRSQAKRAKVSWRAADPTDAACIRWYVYEATNGNRSKAAQRFWSRFFRFDRQKIWKAAGFSTNCKQVIAGYNRPDPDDGE
jgi:hypothetical protein